MRICSPQLGLSPNAVLGGEVFDRELLVHLAKQGVAVQVILPRGLPAPDCTHLDIDRLWVRRGLRWFVSNPVFAAYIGRAYAHRPFDLIRVHSLRFTGRAALWARSVFNLPVPIVAHHHHIDNDMWTHLVDRSAALRCDRIITGSRFAKAQLVNEFRLEPDKVDTVYYGVGNEFRPSPPDAALCQRLCIERKRVILYLGSLSKRKNLETLVTAFHQLALTRSDTVLIIAGDGPCGPSLRRQAQMQGVEHLIRFPGHIPETEKPAWYNLADVFVLPSRLEGFGLVAAEAMACAKPVVASKAGALPEVVPDGEAGFLCEPDDPDAFAKAIAEILDNAELACAMAGEAMKRANILFRWDRCAEEVARIYSAAIGRYRAE
jgi:glycosyltransferase involved in cell wall biosynthesis